MPQVNLVVPGRAGHVLPSGMLSAPISARPFDPTSFPEDRARLQKLTAAIRTIDHYVNQSPNVITRCNGAFRALPGGRTFAEIWRDANIWISFTADPNTGNFGWSLVGGTDVAISNGSFVRSIRFIAASIVHELAHLNGAPPNGTSAEGSLLQCGFADMRDENIVGALSRPRIRRSVMA